MPEVEILTLEVEASFAGVRSLAGQASAFLAARGWSPEACFAVEILICEHGNNAVEHGELPANSRLGLELRPESERAVLILDDAGSPPPAPGPPPDDPLSTRGRGRQVLDGVASDVRREVVDGRQRTTYIVERAWTPPGRTSDA